MQAVAEAWRNLTAVGATPLAITDNMNFGNPEKPEIMGQFAAAIRGMAEACRALDFPVVSGNVSLYNETEGRAILPTPAIGGLGVLEDAAKAVGIALSPGSISSSLAPRRLARPVTLAAGNRRARGGRAAAGRSASRAGSGRFRARAESAPEWCAPATTSLTADFWSRWPKWRWRGASARGSRLVPPIFQGTPSGSERTRAATCSPLPIPRRSSAARRSRAFLLSGLGTAAAKI